MIKTTELHGIRIYVGFYVVRNASVTFSNISLTVAGESEEPGKPATVDTTALAAAIETAETLTESDYTAKSWEALAEALENAQAVLASADATQDEVDEAAAALTAAVAALVPAESGEPDAVDTTELEKAIDTAETLIEDDYTAESWKAFAAALADAQEVLADADATQAEVDAVAQMLTAAIEALENVETETPKEPETPEEPETPSEEATVDTTALAVAIETAGTYSSAGYTAATWNALQEALANAQAVLAEAEEGTADQSAVDTAASELTAAINALQKTSSGGRDASASSSGGGSSSGGSSSTGITGNTPNSGSVSGSWTQMADGSWNFVTAAGAKITGSTRIDADGNPYDQIAWAKINGAWYAFDSDSCAVDGWVYDYDAAKWYHVDIDSGMKTGWHQDSQDHSWYYLDPSSGAMKVGWQQIDGIWYYLNAQPQAQTWLWDEENAGWMYDVTSIHKPLGAMYRSEMTPDGYYVDENGAWFG